MTTTTTAQKVGRSLRERRQTAQGRSTHGIPCVISASRTLSLHAQRPVPTPMRTTILLSLLFTAASWSAEAPSTSAQALVEQMRGHSMQPSASMRSDGTVSPEEKLRQEIIAKLRALGPPCLPSLVAVLSDPEVQMRRNAELVLIQLASAYDGKPRMDIRAAIPALITATQDNDPDVRAWAAHALAEIGRAAGGPLPRSDPPSRTPFMVQAIAQTTQPMNSLLRPG